MDLFFMSSASQDLAVSFLFLYKRAILIVGIFKGVSYEGKRSY